MAGFLRFLFVLLSLNLPNVAIIVTLSLGKTGNFGVATSGDSKNGGKGFSLPCILLQETYLIWFSQEKVFDFYCFYLCRSSL